MMFDVHDTDSLVLSDIRELLYIIACEGLPTADSRTVRTQQMLTGFQMRRMRSGETNDAATGVPFREGIDR
jgi:hypothetical protein